MLQPLSVPLSLRRCRAVKPGDYTRGGSATARAVRRYARTRASGSPLATQVADHRHRCGACACTDCAVSSVIPPIATSGSPRARRSRGRLRTISSPTCVVAGGLGRGAEAPDRSPRSSPARRTARPTCSVGVRREADDRRRRRADRADRRRRQVLLADVDAVGAREPGDVRAIVDDDRALMLTVRSWTSARCGRQERVARHRLRRAAGEMRAPPSQIRAREIENRPAGARRRDVGVEGRRRTQDLMKFEHAVSDSDRFSEAAARRVRARQEALHEARCSACRRRTPGRRGCAGAAGWSS